MTGKRISVFTIILMLSAFSVVSVPVNVLAQQELVPEWTYEDGGWFSRVTISADGSHIGVGTNDTGRFYLFQGDVLLWNYSVGSVHSVSMSSDGRYIAVGAGRVFYLFDREDSLSPLLSYPLDYEASIVAISSDGKYVVVGTMPNASKQDVESKIYVFVRGQLQPSWIRTLPGVLEGLSMSSSGDYIVASTSFPGAIYFFSRGQETPLWSYGFGERSGGVKLSDDGEYVVAVGGNQSDRVSRRVYRFSRESSTPRYVKIISEVPSRWGVSVSSNGSTFALSYESSNRLVFFNLELPPYGYGPGSVLNVSLPARRVSMSMSADGRYVFVGTVGGVFVYEYSDYQLSLKKQYAPSSLVVQDVSCSSDGRYVVAAGSSRVSGDESNRVYFFDMNSLGDSWSQLSPIVVGLIAVVIAGAGFVFYRSYRRVRGRH